MFTPNSASNTRPQRSNKLGCCLLCILSYPAFILLGGSPKRIILRLLRDKNGRFSMHQHEVNDFLFRSVECFEATKYEFRNKWQGKKLLDLSLGPNPSTLLSLILCFHLSTFDSRTRTGEPFSLYASGLWLAPLVPTTNACVSHPLNEDRGVRCNLPSSINCFRLRGFHATRPF